MGKESGMAIQKNKLWLKGFFPDRSNDEIRKFCEKFGKPIHMSRPQNRDYIFLTFDTEEDALQAQANFVRCRYDCRYAKSPKQSTSGSTTNSSPSNSSPSPEASSSSLTSSPNKDKRRVHFSSDIVAPPSQTASKRRANRTTKSNDVSAAAAPQKTVFRNGEKIIITFVQSASSFYAHSASMDKQRHDLIKKMCQLAERMDCVSEPPKFMALAPFNNGYYRAIIKTQASDMNDSVLVTLVDIGRSVNVPCDKLKPIPNEYTTIKISNRFTLDGIDGSDANDVNESYAARCLRCYIGKQLILECADEVVGRLSSVQLVDPETNQNINDKIKEMQRTFIEDELVRAPAPLGENQKLITVDASKLASGVNLITLIEANHLPLYVKQTKRIQVVGTQLKKYPPYMPEEGELCLVQHSNQWHRAVFIKKASSSSDAGGDSEDTCVLLIDSSKGVLIKSKSIRKITEELVHMSILPFTVAINGHDQTIDEAKVEQLLQKFKMMTMTSVKSVSGSSGAAIYTIDI